MMLSHTELIQYMKKRNYSSDIEGVCTGLAYMGMEAVLLDEGIEDFNAHLADIKKDISNNYTLTSRQLNEKGITAFLDGVELYHQAFKYPYLFEKNDRPVYQNALLTAPLTMSIGIENQGGIYKIDNFCGVYSKEELINLFSSLRKSVHSFPDPAILPVALILSNLNHRICVGYDPQKKEWVFIEANWLPARCIQKDEEVASRIMISFQSFETFVVFNTEVYITSQNKKLFTNICNSWKGSPQWESAHTLTSEKNSFRDISGMTLLFAAVWNSHIEVIRLLLEKGANPNKTPASGVTPLLIAAQNGHIEIVHVLLEEGANPNLASKISYVDGVTPLYVAAQNGYIEIVRVLLEKGANPNKIPANGVTPLLVAAQHGHIEIAHMLLAAGTTTFTQEEGCVLFINIMVHIDHNLVENSILAPVVRSWGWFDNDKRHLEKIRKAYLYAWKTYQEVTLLLEHEEATKQIESDANRKFSEVDNFLKLAREYCPFYGFDNPVRKDNYIKTWNETIDTLRSKAKNTLDNALNPQESKRKHFYTSSSNDPASSSSSIDKKADDPKGKRPMRKR